ncbi:MAG: MFS transporter [Alphaproteobacteria bacterium]|nr:MAG: MFS transporter [Alphaproteobacteria bacterium]
MGFKKLFSAFWILSGSMLEYYDYMLFTYMMPVFSPILFPSYSYIGSMLIGYGLIFASSIFRPVGAIIMGYVGDVFGRRYGLLLSICLISFASLGMGLIPSYSTIGIWTFILVFVFRVFQAMSAGGDLNGSAIFLIEHFGTTPGLASGIAWSSTILGMLLASFANYIAVHYNYGWRLTFIIGGLIGFLGMLVRAYIIEGEGYAKKPKNDCSPKSVYPYLAVIGLGAGIGGMYYYTMVFTYTYLKSSGIFISQSFLALSQSCFFIVYFIAVILSGWISDRVNIYKLMYFFASMLFLTALPIFYSIKAYYLITQFIVVLLLGMFVGPSHSMMVDLFPPKYRYRSISICYGIGTSLIGGATLYVCTRLLVINPVYCVIWMMLCAAFGFIGVLCAQNSPKIDYLD